MSSESSAAAAAASPAATDATPHQPQPALPSGSAQLQQRHTPTLNNLLSKPVGEASCSGNSPFSAPAPPLPISHTPGAQFTSPQQSPVPRGSNSRPESRDRYAATANAVASGKGVYPLPPSNELPHLIPHPQHPPPHPQAVSLQPQPQPHPAGYPSSYGVGPPPQGAPPPQGFWAHRPPMHPGYPPIHPAYGYPPMAGGQPIVYHHPGYSAHPMMRMTHMQQQDLVKMPNGPNPLEWAAMQRQKEGVVSSTTGSEDEKASPSWGNQYPRPPVHPNPGAAPPPHAMIMQQQPPQPAAPIIKKEPSIVDRLVGPPNAANPPEVMPQRREFFERLVNFCERHGEPITMIPLVSKQSVDLHRLYIAVRNKGGFEQVTKDKAWKAICADANPTISESSAAGYQLRRHYQRHLLMLECIETGRNAEEMVAFADKLKKKKKEPAASTAQGSDANAANANAAPVPAPSSSAGPSAAATAAPSAANSAQPGAASLGAPQSAPPVHGYPPPGHDPSVPTYYYGVDGRPQAVPPGWPPHPHLGSPGYPPGAYRGPPMMRPPHIMMPNQPPVDLSHLSEEQRTAYLRQQQAVAGSMQAVEHATASTHQADSASRAPSAGPPGGASTPDSTSRLSATDGAERPTSSASNQALTSQPSTSMTATASAASAGHYGQPPPMYPNGGPPSRPGPPAQPQQQPPQPHPSQSMRPPGYPPPPPSGYPPPHGGYPPDAYQTHHMQQQYMQHQMWQQHQAHAAAAAAAQQQRFQQGQQGAPPMGVVPSSAATATSAAAQAAATTAPTSAAITVAATTGVAPLPPTNGATAANSAQRFYQQRVPQSGACSPSAPSVQANAATRSAAHSKYAGAPAGSFPSPLPSSASAIRAQQQAAASYATPSSGIQGGGGPSQANATPGMASNSSAATGAPGGGPPSTAAPSYNAAPPPQLPALFPAGSVEAASISQRRRPKLLTRHFVGATPRRLVMALRSGLHCEVVWSLNALNTMLYDESAQPPSLSQLPGLLQCLVEHLASTLAVLWPKEFGLSDERSTRLEAWQAAAENDALVEELLEGTKSSVNGIVAAANNKKTNFTKITRTGRKVHLKDATLPPHLRKFMVGQKMNEDGESFLETTSPSASGSSCATGGSLAQRLAERLRARIAADRNRRGARFALHGPRRIDELRRSEEATNKEEFTDPEQDESPFFYCTPNRMERAEYPNDVDMNVIRGGALTNRDPAFVDVADRCLAISNIIRGFSFISGNESQLAAHPGLLQLLAKFLRLMVEERIVRRVKTSSGEETEEDKKKQSSLVESDSEESLLLFDVSSQLREDAFVVITHLSVVLDLYEMSEEVSYPLLDGLLHWAVSVCAEATDPLLQGCISPRDYALEALCKLCVVESNVDLLLSTGKWPRIENLVKGLAKLLPMHEDTHHREFAIVILNALCMGSEAVCWVAALDTQAIPALITFIEMADQNMHQVMQGHGMTALRENPEMMGTSVGMLRRAASMLHTLTKIEGGRRVFEKQQQRLLQFTMSQLMDSRVAATIAETLFEVQRGTRKEEAHKEKKEARRYKMEAKKEETQPTSTPNLAPPPAVTPNLAPPPAANRAAVKESHFHSSGTESRELEREVSPSAKEASPQDNADAAIVSQDSSEAATVSQDDDVAKKQNGHCEEEALVKEEKVEEEGEELGTHGDKEEEAEKDLCMEESGDSLPSPPRSRKRNAAVESNGGCEVKRPRQENGFNGERKKASGTGGGSTNSIKMSDSTAPARAETMTAVA